MQSMSDLIFEKSDLGPSLIQKILVVACNIQIFKKTNVKRLIIEYLL